MTAAPAKKTMGFDGEFVIREWDAPLFLEAGPRALPIVGYPALYLPRLGYLAFDRVSWSTPLIPEAEEYAYSLTFALAPDFLGDGGGDGGLEWTAGLTLKYFSSRIAREEYWEYDPALATRGFAFDLGLAWQWSVLEGLEARAGAAFQNLGPIVRYGEAQREYDSPLPERYRLGVSLEYRLPWQVRFRGHDLRWARILVAQDAGKEFSSYDAKRRPRPFYQSFIQDFDKSRAQYWQEMEISAGAEAKLLEILSLRLGLISVPWMGDSVHYTFGFGLGTPVVFERFLFRYDYGRYFKDPDEFPYHTWKDYGFQACMLF